MSHTGPADAPLRFGSALLLLIVPVHFFVPESVSIQIAALLLALIAGAYIGFAAVDGRWRAILTEFAGATVYFGAALAGLMGWPLAIPAAIALHAVWDFAHHNPHFGAKVPRWYIPFCVIIDAVTGAVLFLLYM